MKLFQPWLSPLKIGLWLAGTLLTPSFLSFVEVCYPFPTTLHACANLSCLLYFYLHFISWLVKALTDHRCLLSLRSLSLTFSFPVSWELKKRNLVTCFLLLGVHRFLLSLLSSLCYFPFPSVSPQPNKDLFQAKERKRGQVDRDGLVHPSISPFFNTKTHCKNNGT